MTDIQIFLVILAIPATVYQIMNLLVMHGVVVHHGTGKLKTSWWLTILGTVFVQVVAAVQILEAVFG